MKLLFLTLLFVPSSLFLCAQKKTSTDQTDKINIAADKIESKCIGWRRDIHEHPELGNNEHRTAKLIAVHLRSLGIEVKEGIGKTGVVGILKGTKPGPCIALRADMDGLPIVERVDLPFASKVKSIYNGKEVGVMHACGHDTHVAILMSVAEILAGLKKELKGTVVFVFQPSEEGPPEGEEGGAPLMIKEGVLDQPKVQAMYGLHMDPTLDFGEVGWSVGPIFASSDRFVIEIQGKKTHGAYPHTGLDPVPVAAELIQALQLVVSRQIDAQDPKVLTIGSIHGGNRFNIVADQVTLEGTIRALEP